MDLERDLTLRTIETPDELEYLRDLIEEVFGDPVPSVVDIRGSLLAGGVCVGAFRDDRLVGGVWSFAGWDEAGPFHHSHTLGVAPDVQGHGIGAVLKAFHADWCRDRGIERIRWTFDPLMPNNARFNLNKVGAVGDRWIRDCYGPMAGKLDPEARTGDAAPSDRLSVTLYLGRDPIEGGSGTVLVPIPPTGDAPDALTAGDAVSLLRRDLEPVLDGKAIVTSVERRDGGWAYRVVPWNGGSHAP